MIETYDPNYTKENPTGANNGNDSNSDSSDNGSGLPGWAIAVIVIACIAFVAAICAIGAVIYLRRRQKQSRQPMTMTEAAAIAAARQNQNQPHQPPPAAGGGTTKSDVGSIYSSTPIIGAAGSHSRGSAASTEGSGSTRHRASPPADSFRNLMYSEWKSRVPPGEQEEEEEELRRRRLGEALLQRELEEEGAAVKHTDRRPMTVAPPEALESKAVVLERQDGKNSQPSSPL
ncbi:hypothetical protein BDC45DRAFT_212591 [Circinella umbellata]|nr:hypothetical protein BDC45DRAFT_212591 [Circinella umbellata]